jgi:hypothetical protein
VSGVGWRLRLDQGCWLGRVLCWAVWWCHEVVQEGCGGARSSSLRALPARQPLITASLRAPVLATTKSWISRPRHLLLPLTAASSRQSTDTTSQPASPPPFSKRDKQATRNHPTMAEMAPKVALVTGVCGQDGSYLVELLLEKGYIVHGEREATRSARRTQRGDHRSRPFHTHARKPRRSLTCPPTPPLTAHRPEEAVQLLQPRAPGAHHGEG